MFRGHSYHTIDTKGRIIIPSRFRAEIQTGGGDGVMITRRDNCLFVYTFDEWSEIERHALALAKKDKRTRRFVRFFVGAAYECPCDKQWRVLIPQPLREYAGLEKEIVLTGMLERFEIWDRQRWDAGDTEMQDALDDEEYCREIDNIGI
ncbi:MAG: division/cell wall cluster transcriptional repressor MraZ [Deltaproteobacteria bacterium]|nr:MAG: division/cell wall cluster transcriptional repressor MraZ [Deltaproteobacteria bacterium]